MIQMLLDAKVDPNVQSRDGYTALMEACWWGYTDTAGLLLEHGADPNVQDNYGKTALMEACRSGHTDIARLLLEHGADPNVQNNDGTTALTAACSNPRGNRDVITALITAGAELDKRNNNGMTALMYLARNGYTGLMKLLIKDGADMNIKDAQGRTAFDILWECHPEKYDKWIKRATIKERKKTLKHEDSVQNRGGEPDFDI